MGGLIAIIETVSRVFDQPAFFLGLVALVGLLLQRKSVAEIIQGAVQTVIGLLILQAGAATLAGSIAPITEMLRTGWGVSGVFPFNEPAWIFVMQTMASTIVPTFVLGWLVHVLLVRTFSRRFRCVYLTAHMMPMAAALFNIGLSGAFGLSGLGLIVTSAVFCAIFWTVLPQWTYRYSKEFVGDRFTLGHQIHVGCILAAELGKIMGRSEEEDANPLQLPGALQMLQDPAINAAVTMPILFFLLGVAVGIPVVEAAASDLPWYLYLVMQGLVFAAGLTVLVLGVQLFLAAIESAFKGFRETILPGAIPALDIPVFFPSSPMGNLLGFLGGAAGMILVSLVLFLVKAPLFVFPSLIMAFFETGAEGVFAYHFGGWRAALIAGFAGGVIFSLGILWLQPLTPQLSGQGVQFGNIDTVTIMAPLFWLFRLVGRFPGLAQLLQ